MMFEVRGMANMEEKYFKCMMAGYLGANIMCGPKTERLDIINEIISHYC